MTLEGVENCGFCMSCTLHWNFKTLGGKNNAHKPLLIEKLTTDLTA